MQLVTTSYDLHSHHSHAIERYCVSSYRSYDVFSFPIIYIHLVLRSLHGPIIVTLYGLGQRPSMISLYRLGQRPSVCMSTGGRAKGWCLTIHAEASITLALCLSVVNIISLSLSTGSEIFPRILRAVYPQSAATAAGHRATLGAAAAGSRAAWRRRRYRLPARRD
jgi:hypothetical protein